MITAIKDPKNRVRTCFRSRRSCIDFLAQIPKTLPSNYLIDDLKVSVIDYVPPRRYPETDRHQMPPHYLCGESLFISDRLSSFSVSSQPLVMGLGFQ